MTLLIPYYTVTFLYTLPYYEMFHTLSYYDIFFVLYLFRHPALVFLETMNPQPPVDREKPDGRTDV